MRRLFLCALVLAVAMSAWATGRTEETQKLTVLHSGHADFGDPYGLQYDYVSRLVQKDFPGTEIDLVLIDLSDGSAFTITAMLAAGIAPNVYIDTLVRSSAYIVPEYALPLDGLIRDLDKYDASTLAPYRRDGKLLALPIPGGAQGMAINLDIMDEIGFTVRPDWTIDEFLEMARRVKARYGGEKWATGMFAANQSGDYLINNWFASFGVQYYKAGDYSRTTIRETGGAAVHEFFQTLAREGYIPPGSATLDDDDYVIQWAEGSIAATAFFDAWQKPYFDTLVEQGKINAPHRYTYVPFPRAAGVDRVPTYYLNGAMVAHRTGKAIDQVAARFIEYANAPELQVVMAGFGTLPNRTDVQAEMSPMNAVIMEIVRTQGIFDVGLTSEKFSATRPTHFPILQQVLNLRITPEASIERYEQAINEALK